MVFKIIAYMVIGLYTLSLVYITFYCLIQFHLLLKYKKAKKHLHQDPLINESPTAQWPKVTIQLPIYNERFVVERLIDNIVNLKYPADLLEIQILDDSTDDTQDVCKNKAETYRQQGIDIKYIHRTNRDGFKAGALRDGLEIASGDFIAIFDADFLPHADFLLQTIPLFNDEQVGVVQTRWDHINGGYSMITRLQAFQLNVHFTIEQSGRQFGNFMLQFNGTAGVWRRKTIQDAGGWEADTLTEDLDLSYRAQLRGWKIRYRQDISSPAELPVEMNGLKSQQFRWMKGGAENARKLLGKVLQADIPFVQKLHASAHLLSSSIFLVVFALAVLSVPALFMIDLINLDMTYYSFFLLGILTVGYVYFEANKDTMWAGLSPLQRIGRFILMFPLFLSLSMGLSLHNSIAVIEGFIGKKSSFVRTPKFNIQQIRDSIQTGVYRTANISFTTIMEALLSLYFLSAVILGILQGKTSFLLYHLMLMIGFASIFIFTVRHLRHQ